MEYYNTARPGGIRRNLATAPMSTQDVKDYTTSNVPGAMANQSGDVHAKSQQGKVGWLTTGQLGTAWGGYDNFRHAGKQGAIEAVQQSGSIANPEDYMAMDELRNYYRNKLGGLEGQSADQRSVIDTQMQRGLRNNLGQLRNANAGTGRLGTRSYVGDQGDILSKANSDYFTGLINARADELNQAEKIRSGLSGVQNQNLEERKFQTVQGKMLADEIYRQMVLESGFGDKGAMEARQSKEDLMQLLGYGAQIAAASASSGGSK